MADYINNCMYCGKLLVNGVCTCTDWQIANNYPLDMIQEENIENEELSEEEQSYLFLEQLFKEIKAEFEYQCPNCLGKFNKPHIIKSKGTHYHCPFCGLYMTGLSGI